MKKYTSVFICLLLSACSSQIATREKNDQSKTIYLNEQQQRINTIECQDFDDWYLDGFRVGKTFPSYKQKLLDYRINFCDQKLTEQQKQRFIQNWLNAFDIGSKSGHKGK